MRGLPLIIVLSIGLVTASLLSISVPHLNAETGEYFVYFGTYTATISKGIYAWRFQPSSGRLSEIGPVAEGPNPSFLAFSPDRRHLYVVNWKGSETVKGNTVSAYAVDGHTGKLTFLNKVDSRGEMPTHLTVDSTGRMMLVANYGSGSVAAFKILNDGRLSDPTSFDQHQGLSVVKERQEGPHAHAVVLSADNRFAFVADLGLDKVFSYRLEPAKAAFSSNDPPFVKAHPGAGPRHLAFHPNGKFLYANNEIDSTVTVYAYDRAAGTLREVQTSSTLPADFKGRNSTAEIHADNAGKFLYVSNRGHDSIAVFAIDPAKGTLTAVEHVSTQGKTPRNFSLDPTGDYLFAANENSSTVVVFRVDRNSGRLRPTGQVLQVPSPSCIVFRRVD
jgi:6-phosphogluconolactonase